MAEGGSENGGAEAAPPDPAQLAASRIGTVVDKYTVVRLLGRGGMGAVYEARHARLARRFGIKFLLPELAANREVLRRFENEAKAAGGLEHPNLVAVTDFGRATDGAPYIVMEFLEGEDCSKLLRRLGPLPVPRAANIVLQACRGLAVAHRAEIIHRDLKPENLFVADAGDGSNLVKVLDFGIAKLRPSEASVVTGTGATFGTAFYMSPEQARGAGDVDPRTDVWSLGVVLYELLTGKKPFQGEQFLQVIHQILSVEPPPVTALRASVPGKLAALIERTMAKDLGQRIPSVMALAAELLPFAGRPSSAEVPVAVDAVAATRATPETASSAPAASAPAAAPSSGPVASAPAAAVPSAAPSSAPGPASRAPAAAQRAVTPLLVAGAVVVAVIVGVVAWRTASPRPAAETALAAPPARVPAATPAPTSPPTPASPRVPTPPTAIAPPNAPAPAVVPVAAVAAPRPVKPARRVRTPSEQSGHGLDPGRVPPARGPAPEPARAIEIAPAPPPPAPAAPRPAAERPQAPKSHRLEIEKNNPYDNQ